MDLTRIALWAARVAAVSPSSSIDSYFAVGRMECTHMVCRGLRRHPNLEAGRRSSLCLDRTNSGELGRIRPPECSRFAGGIASDIGRTARRASLGWMLAMVLGLSFGQSQPVPRDYVLRAIAEGNAGEERVRRWRADARRASQRAGAHFRLGNAANTIHSRALCPVFPSSDSEVR